MQLDTFDEAFPVLVRYAGLLTTLILIGACLAGYTTQAAPGFVAAGGMIFYKTVKDATKQQEESKKDE